MSAAPQLIGRTVAGRFRITGFIGEGAMAAVYRGVQDAEPHDVAVKIMHPQLLGDSTFVGRFRREAKAAARLNHPNTVQIIDYGVDGRLPYIVMELVGGQDLFEILVLERRLPEVRAARILMGICDALSAAHEHGIVHRDLKPENVMILRDPASPGGERVKVLDFGIAKIVDAGGGVAEDGIPTSLSTQALTTVGVVVGTPAYMSPEQCRGDPVDGRSDVYACGILLYLLVTGRLPFQPTGAPWEVAMEHIRKPPPAPSTFLPGIHPGLEAVILTALSKWPAQRHQSAGELREELLRLLPSLAKGSLAPPATVAVPADAMPVESLRSRGVVSVREVVEEQHRLAEGAADDLGPAPLSFRSDTETKETPLAALPAPPEEQAAAPKKPRARQSAVAVLPAPPEEQAAAPTAPRVHKSDPDATTDPVPVDVARALELTKSDPPLSSLGGEEEAPSVGTRVMVPAVPPRSVTQASPGAPAAATGGVAARAAEAVAAREAEPAPARPPAPARAVAPAPARAAASAPARAAASARAAPAKRRPLAAAQGDALAPLIRRQPPPVRPSESLLARLIVPAAVLIGVAVGVLAFLLMR